MNHVSLIVGIVAAGAWAVALWRWRANIRTRGTRTRLLVLLLIVAVISGIVRPATALGIIAPDAFEIIWAALRGLVLITGLAYALTRPTDRQDPRV